MQPSAIKQIGIKGELKPTLDEILKNLPKLFLNHFDAWVTTLGIAVGVLVIHQAFSWSAGLLVFSITVGYWLAFAINDYFDAEIDQLDPIKRNKNFFSLIPLSLPKALVALLAYPPSLHRDFYNLVGSASGLRVFR